MSDCQLYYTLAFAGTFPCDSTTLNYIDSVAERYHDSGCGLCLLIELFTSAHLYIAEHILQLRRMFRDLRLEVIIDQKQWQISQRTCNSTIGMQRNRIIQLADACHVMSKEEKNELSLFETCRLMVSRADEIVCAYLSMKTYVDGCAHFARRRLKVSTVKTMLHVSAPHLQSSRLLLESLDFIRSKRLRVKADDIPMNLLSKWIAVDSGSYMPYFRQLDNNLSDMLRFNDEQGRFLPLKIFVYTYSITNDLWAFGYPRTDDVVRRFEQFQLLLRRTLAARSAGRTLDFVEVFDYPEYDSLIKQTEWVDAMESEQSRRTHL